MTTARVLVLSTAVSLASFAFGLVAFYFGVDWLMARPEKR